MVVVPDWAVYAGYAGVLGLLVGWALARARSAPRHEPGEQEKVEPRSEEKEQESREHVSLDNVLGLDRALAAKFYRSLRKALASGEVKVALISDACPNGYVAYDFTRESWICVEKDGSSYPLDGNPAATLIQEEEV